MTYARIVNGIVTEIIENVDTKLILTSLAFKFFLNKRIDNLDPVPQVGWHYSPETGFTP